MINKLYRILLFFASVIIFSLPVSAQNDCPTWEWADDLALGNKIDILVMKSDSLGNLYYTGSFEDTAIFGPDTLVGSNTANESFFVAKWDLSGAWAWGSQFTLKKTTSIGNSYITKPYDFQLSKNRDYIIVTGSFGASATFDSNTLISSNGALPNAFISKFHINSKNWQWANKIENSNNWVIGSSVDIDNSGNAYVTGAATNVNNNTSLLVASPSVNIPMDTASGYIAKINSAGTWQWLRLHQLRVFYPPCSRGQLW